MFGETFKGRTYTFPDGRVLTVVQILEQVNAASRQMFNSPLKRLFPKYYYKMPLKNVKLWNSVISGLISVSEEIRQETLSNKDENKPITLISQCEDNSFSSALFLKEAITYMRVGHETTARLLTWSVHALIEYPQLISNLRSELIDKPELMTTEEIDSCAFLRKFVYEVLRVYGITPGPFPRISKVDTQLGGYTIQAGTQIASMNAFFHHSEKAWDNAYQFDPERWDGRPVGNGKLQKS